MHLSRHFSHTEPGRPVAFMSKTLQNSKLRYPAVEKEATAIIEAVLKWSHFLMCRPLILITDQHSVAFMFENCRRTKVKNNKIQGWRRVILIQLLNKVHSVPRLPPHQTSLIFTTSYAIQVLLVCCISSAQKIFHTPQTMSGQFVPQFFHQPTSTLIKAT